MNITIFLFLITASFIVGTEAFITSSALRHSFVFTKKTLTKSQRYSCTTTENCGEPDCKYVVLITGCSSGIGKSAALAFSKMPNMKVWATMRNSTAVNFPNLDNGEGNLKIAEMDVTSEESIQSTVAQILREEGKVDVVINNAGYGLAGCLETVTVDEAMKCFNTNVWGVVRVLQAVLPSMRRRRFGYIINISSTSGIRGMPGLDYYTGSKFALEGIMDSARYSLSPFNIPITNVNVGPAVRTSFSERIGKTELGDDSVNTPRDDESSGTSHLHHMKMRAINLLQEACKTSAAQESDEIAALLVQLAEKRFQQSTEKPVQDIPFNIGSGAQSNALLTALRTHPTGWGGIYDTILASIPINNYNNINSTTATI